MTSPRAYSVRQSGITYATGKVSRWSVIDRAGEYVSHHDTKREAAASALAYADLDRIIDADVRRRMP